MGRLLSGFFAILVSVWVVFPAEVASFFDTPRYRAARAELAADRSSEKFLADVKTWTAADRK